ncbi:hypothetical protein AHF37_01161 [Paragonimus kellicotti]|nr:hypothetical protein AHF37_01161 [Paragonimus kellicotti]
MLAQHLATSVAKTTVDTDWPYGCQLLMAWLFPRLTECSSKAARGTVCGITSTSPVAATWSATSADCLNDIRNRSDGCHADREAKEFAEFHTPRSSSSESVE